MVELSYWVPVWGDCEVNMSPPWHLVQEPLVMQDNSLTDGENQKHEIRLTQIYLNNRLFSDSLTETLYWMLFFTEKIT